MISSDMNCSINFTISSGQSTPRFCGFGDLFLCWKLRWFYPLKAVLAKMTSFEPFWTTFDCLVRGFYVLFGTPVANLHDRWRIGEFRGEWPPNCASVSFPILMHIYARDYTIWRTVLTTKIGPDEEGEENRKIQKCSTSLNCSDDTSYPIETKIGQVVCIKEIIECIGVVLIDWVVCALLGSENWLFHFERSMIYNNLPKTTMQGWDSCEPLFV